MKRFFTLFILTVLTACSPGSEESTPKNLATSNARSVTNLLTYSNDLTRSVWIQQGGATTPAANIIMKNGSPYACVTQSVKISGTSVMALVHAKAGSLSSFVLTLYNATKSQSLSTSAYPLTSDYKPYQLTASTNISPGDTIKLYIYPSSSSDTVVGDIDIENTALIDTSDMIFEPESNIERIVTSANSVTVHYSYINNMTKVSCWGDSLTAGGYPSVIDRVLAASQVYNGGIGGETSSQIKSRFLAAPVKWGDLTVVWAGRNNYLDAGTVKADIAEMVSHLTTDRYVILSVLNGNYGNEYVGQPDYNTIIQLNEDLASQYPGHYLDIRAMLVESYNPTLAQDIADHLNDIPPSSFRSDNVHLNSLGYQEVAWAVYRFIVSKGWDTPSQTFLN